LIHAKKCSVTLLLHFFAIYYKSDPFTVYVNKAPAKSVVLKLCIATQTRSRRPKGQKMGRAKAIKN